MNRFITAAIISCSLAIPVSADEHTTTWKGFPRSQRFSRKFSRPVTNGKGLADVVAWGEDFGKLVKENGRLSEPPHGRLFMQAWLPCPIRYAIFRRLAEHCGLW